MECDIAPLSAISPHTNPGICRPSGEDTPLQAAGPRAGERSALDGSLSKMGYAILRAGRAGQRGRKDEGALYIHLLGYTSRDRCAWSGHISTSLNCWALM